jgi:hypothetical protein
VTTLARHADGLGLPDLLKPDATLPKALSL